MHDNNTTMASRHVTLRAMEPEDLELLYGIENDTSLWGVSNTSVPYSRYVLHQYIASSTNDIYADKQVRLMIDNDQNVTVGILDIVNFDPTNLKAEVGIMVKPMFRRQGYALAALHRAIERSRITLHLNQLYAIIACDNEASLKLFRLAGFSDGARLRNWFYDGKEYKDALLLQLFL